MIVTASASDIFLWQIDIIRFRNVFNRTLLLSGAGKAAGVPRTCYGRGSRGSRMGLSLRLFHHRESLSMGEMAQPWIGRKAAERARRLQLTTAGTQRLALSIHFPDSSSGA